MIRIRTLRGRLAAAMLLILFVSMGVASVLDRIEQKRAVPAEEEPVQDAVVLAGFFLPALFLIWAVSWWSLRPLARVSQDASNVGPANPALRLSSAGLPTEIVPLVQAVNAALDRMALAFEAERRLTENAAHELRTPLAVLGLRLQRARQSGAGSQGPDWDAIDGDLLQMNRLVSQLLDLARKENAGRGRDSMTAPIIDLSRIAREACAAILPMVEAKGRTLTLAIPDTLNVRGDADDLRDVLRNLLENAVLHGSGRIVLRGWLDTAKQRVTLCVKDEGPGFDVENAAAAFQRFSKGQSSTGMGLGLAIVREVIRGHNGDVTALPGPPGRIELWLPTSARI